MAKFDIVAEHVDIQQLPDIFLSVVCCRRQDESNKDSKTGVTRELFRRTEFLANLSEFFFDAFLLGFFVLTCADVSNKHLPDERTHVRE